MVRMMMAVGMVLLMGLAGCGDPTPDPETGRIEAGTRAVLVRDEGSVGETVGILDQTGDRGYVELPPGTEVVVVDDSRPDMKGIAGNRVVAVTVDRPEFAGQGDALRRELRPAAGR